MLHDKVWCLALLEGGFYMGLGREGRDVHLFVVKFSLNQIRNVIFHDVLVYTIHWFIWVVDRIMILKFEPILELGVCVSCLLHMP